MACYGIFDILTEANAELSKGDEASLVKAGKMLAEAGKQATKVDHDFIKSIGVEDHFGFLSTVLNEFLAFEATGAFDSEELAKQTIFEHKALIDLCEAYLAKVTTKEVVETKEVKETIEIEVETKSRR